MNYSRAFCDRQDRSFNLHYNTHTIVPREAIFMSVKCSKCQAQAVYLRRYTAEALCKDCLRDTTQERVRRTINKHKMLLENDRIVVAISGGKDSAVLLNILFQIEENYPKTEIIKMARKKQIGRFLNHYVLDLIIPS